MNKIVVQVTLPTILEEGMDGLKEDWPCHKWVKKNGIKMPKSTGSKGKNVLTLKHRSSLKRFISLMDSKKRQSLLQYLRPEFKRYIKRAMHPPKKSVKVLQFDSSKSTKCSPPSTSIGSKRIHKIGQKISRCLVKRSIDSKPLPRLPIFYCQKCGLTSKKLRVLDNHICGKRIQEYKNLSQIVELGFRSRVKDGMAVLERTPRPQAFSLTKTKHRYANKDRDDPFVGEHNQQPKSLFEISWLIIQRLYGLDRNFALIKTTLLIHTPQPSISTTPINDHDYFRRRHSSSSTVENFANFDVPQSSSQSNCITKTTQEDSKDPIEEKMVNSLNGNAFFCQRCCRLFGRYADWDNHLQLPDIENEVTRQIACGASADDLTEIQVYPGELFPISGQFISRNTDEEITQPNSCQDEKLPKPNNSNKWQCTKCWARGFLTRPEFHSHLMKCAMLWKMEEKQPKNCFINLKQLKGNTAIVKSNGKK